MTPYNAWATDDGQVVVQVGLLQISRNPALCAKGQEWADPPVFRDDVGHWLSAHGSAVWDPGVFGPPGFKFPDIPTALEFIAQFQIDARWDDEP